MRLIRESLQDARCPDSNLMPNEIYKCCSFFNELMLLVHHVCSLLSFVAKSKENVSFSVLQLNAVSNRAEDFQYCVTDCITGKLLVFSDSMELLIPMKHGKTRVLFHSLGHCCELYDLSHSNC